MRRRLKQTRDTKDIENNLCFSCGKPAQTKEVIPLLACSHGKEPLPTQKDYVKFVCYKCLSEAIEQLLGYCSTCKYYLPDEEHVLKETRCFCDLDFTEMPNRKSCQHYKRHPYAF